MGQHNLKAILLQVNTILSKLVSYISVGNALRYTGDFDLSHPKSLITREAMEAVIGNGLLIGPWDSGPVDAGLYRTYPVAGTYYLWLSTEDGNEATPGFTPGNGWQVIGVTDGGSASRIAVEVPTGDITIDWQNDTIPGDTLKWVERYGNIIGDIVNQWNDSGTIRKNSPEWFYTMDGTDIDTVTINTLFEGTITIL